MAKKADKAPDGSKLICKNRQAHREYNIEEKLEAGIVLCGSEVKSCRDGRVDINGAFVRVLNNEAILVGSHIAEYKNAGQFGHEPKCDRKLLLNRKQIDKLEVRLRQQGQSAVPLTMYFKNGYAKVELGIGKGRSYADRRDVVRDRENKREIERTMRKRR